jgi:NTE family protein
VPTTARAIQNRINEISFNASLLRELRAIDFVQRLLEDGTLQDGRMKRLRLHMIADDDLSWWRRNWRRVRSSTPISAPSEQRR